MLKNFIYLIFGLILISANVNGQNNSLVDAENFSITKSEFIKRYELTPKVQSSIDGEKNKNDFLLTLIAEKIWANETRKAQIEITSDLKFYLNNIEKMFVRDAFFKDEIASKVIISNDEISKEMINYKTLLYFNFLFAESKMGIDSLYQLLKNNIPIDSIILKRPERLEQTSPIEVKYAQLDFEKEEILFGLEKGKFTKPIFMENGWVIYFLKDKKSIPLPNQKFSDVYREVSDRLKNKKTKKLYEDFIQEFYKGKKANAAEDQFIQLSNELKPLLNYKFNNNTSIKNEAILYYEDLLSIEKRIDPSTLEKPLINIGENQISLRAFIHYLGFQNFKIKKDNLQNINNVLNIYIKDFIKMEFLSIAAYEKGYDKLPEIKEELSIWEDNYLAQIYKNKIIDSVRTNFNKNYKPQNDLITEVKVKEITVDNLDQVNAIFDFIESGFTLENAAKKIGIKQTESKFNGIDYIPIFQTEGYQETLKDMKIGEIFGPFTTSSGYSIINLIDKHEIKSDSLSALVKEQNLFDELQKVLEVKTAELARENKISINNEILKSIKVSDVKMIVYRKFGFGGALNAAPFVNIFADWKEIYEKLKEISL